MKTVDSGELKVEKPTEDGGSRLFFMLEYSKIPFIPLEHPPAWELTEKLTETKFGKIAWSEGWQRFVFVPGERFVRLDHDILRGIADFLVTETKKYREFRKQAPEGI